ncbi:MAG: sulfite exporter TauE/SafE family protein, partial [Proteobacteria bacterium]|nr:sulfite exporter TauE/SafE family protein [Pseudomonadota bacterium]
ATGATTVVATAVSGVLDHWRRRNVDVRMGGALLLGGLVGSALSVVLFGVLRRLGQVDLVVSLAYVVLLGVLGGLMLIESLRALYGRKAAPKPRHLRRRAWIVVLPWKMRFPKSRLYVSLILPVGTGAVVGILAGIMGVGGGFMLVPAMVYLLEMPTAVVVGTSLFQIIFVSANVTILQAYAHQTVDVLLAVMLILGGAVSAPFGARLGHRLGADRLRALMAALVLSIAVSLGYQLIATPGDVYSIEVETNNGNAEVTR